MSMEPLCGKCKTEKNGLEVLQIKVGAIYWVWRLCPTCIDQVIDNTNDIIRKDLKNASV